MSKEMADKKSMREQFETLSCMIDEAFCEGYKAVGKNLLEDFKKLDSNEKLQALHIFERFVRFLDNARKNEEEN